MEQVRLTRDSILAACEQPDMVFGYDGARWGLMPIEHSRRGFRVTPWVLTEIDQFQEHYFVTVAIVTVDEIATVWNNRAFQVIVIVHNGAIIKKFLNATPRGRCDSGTNAMIAYDETWNVWTGSVLGIDDMLRLWGYDC